MTVEILGPEKTSECVNAERLKRILEVSAPNLNDPKIRLAIVPQVFTKGREIDCVLVFEDTRPVKEMFRTTSGIPVHSFVACVEVKNHSPDDVQIHGTHLEVKYNDGWHNATSQADAQVWALKGFQEFSYSGKARRKKTYVQSVLWLPRVPSGSLPELPNGRSRIVLADLTWARLIEGFEENSTLQRVQTLVPEDRDSHYHSYDTLVKALTDKVAPTRLDMERMNALTQKRFDADRQAYVRNLGSGLLMFRGRAGTGKTFALIQMAIHLARKGERTRIVTYNHGLISDMSRAMEIIRDHHRDISPVPNVETRWTLMETLFSLAFGIEAVSVVNKLYVDLGKREDIFLRALRWSSSFLKEAIPCCANNAAGKQCHCNQRPENAKTWSDISKYRKNFPPPYDYLLVDEGQDWSTDHRDLMYDVFGPDRVIVADGVDQFVDLSRCDWDRGDVAKNRIVPLRTSRRTKAATCDTITDLARALEVPNWDVEPDQAMTGGRLTVLVEPHPYRAIQRAFELLGEDLAAQSNMKPVDALMCLPHKGATAGVNYPKLFERAAEQIKGDYWCGYDRKTRQNREYPRRQSQLRTVLYESCRGMEGWTTLCMGLDQFYDYVTAKPDIDIEGLRDDLKADLGFLFSKAAFEEKLAAERRVYALNWLMIPLTRSMDHLIIHITNEKSLLGRVLQSIDHDKIRWR
ncbi:hypothetical protein [Sagittula sp. SSi028]|uniref:hypothetical protein n=1 Tax=Sagittula sp. SSi028 TaxID=3400636 RepID=UPI003AF6EDBB